MTPQVAILVDDLSVASKFSNIFRKLGVIPHFYDDLKSFWYGTIDVVPALVVVDVLKMSAGELTFSEHPKVIAEELNIAFYHTQASLPLTYSTYNMLSLGTINGEGSLEGQVKAILKRLNSKLEQSKNLSSLEDKLSESERKCTDALKVVDTNKEGHYMADLLTSICEKLSNSNATDFVTRCDEVFNQFAFIENYTFLELDSGNKRLSSSKVNSEKYIEIPSLWIGETATSGIAHHAQNLATQVALEIYEGELMVLSISGQNANPDMLIYIGTNDEAMLNHFNWDFLENHLSGIFSRELLLNTVSEKAVESDFNSWQLIDAVDSDFFRATESEELKLINVDFSALLDVIRNRPDVRFFWANFYEEFTSRFSLISQTPYRISSMGIRDLGVVYKDDDGIFFDLLKDFANSFPYWRYFENSELTIGKDLRPSIRMIPVSSEAYFNFLDRREVVYSRTLTNSSIEQKNEFEDIIQQKQNLILSESRV